MIRPSYGPRVSKRLAPNQSHEDPMTTNHPISPNTSLRPAIQRRNDLRRALSEVVDPIQSDELLNQVMRAYLTHKICGVEEVALTFRNEAYEHLSPLEAAHLFAERYQLAIEDGPYQWDSRGQTGLEGGLINAQLTTLRHVWRARQQADMLGLEYDEYIDAVLMGHAARGYERPPLPRELHGKVPMAVAAYAHQDNTLSAVHTVLGS